MTLRPTLFVASLLSLGMLAGCPENNGGNDGGSGDGGSGDGGEVDAGYTGPCRNDLDCDANLYCDRASGDCLNAKPCAADVDCRPPPGDDDYCVFDKCVCDTARNGGSCVPRLDKCEPCTRDLECGTQEIAFDNYTASCVEYQGARVCLPTTALGCPRGYVISTTFPGSCEPGGGSCENAEACGSDAECDPQGRRPVCDLNRGFCVAPCTFNYTDGTSTCPGGQVCHVDPRFLQPGNRNFGAGRCGVPCDSGENPYQCPATLTCEADSDPLLVSVPKFRCRPPRPKCVRDPDCPQLPAEHSLGYCDQATLGCMGGCRDARDCNAGYKCVEGACTEETCIEQGGAELACNRGQLCCGQPGSPAPCASGVNEGECYDAPRPQWCGECGASVATPGGSDRPQPSQCISFTDGNGAQRTLAFHACHDLAEELTADPTRKAQCPRTMRCGGFLQFCETNADCGAGGECGDIDAGPRGTYKGCHCQGGKTCPSPSRCDDQGEEPSNVCLAGWCENFIDECVPLPEQ